MMLLLYMIATVPIFADMGLQEIISFLTIPNMIINLINNVLFIPLVKRYPAAWKNSFFYMPKPALWFTIILSIMCDVVISAALFTTIDSGGQIGMIVTVAVLFVYSGYRLKTGKVDFQSIEKTKIMAEKSAMNV